MAKTPTPSQQGGSNTPPQQPAQQGGTPSPQQGSTPIIRDWAAF